MKNEMIKLLQNMRKVNNISEAPISVYVFLYNSDCCESAATTISIHKSRKGAETAMELHKNEKLKEWEQECKEYPPAKDYPFDFDRWWGVDEMQLLP